MAKLIRLLLIVTPVLSISAYSFSSQLWVAALNNAKQSQVNTNLQSNLSVTRFQNEYQLLFVYSSTCPYCHKFARVLAQFAQDNNLAVASLTADGGIIMPFNDSKYDSDRISSLGVNTYPTLLAINKRTKATYLINQGAIPYSELNSNFNQVLQFLYGGQDAS